MGQQDLPDRIGLTGAGDPAARLPAARHPAVGARHPLIGFLAGGWFDLAMAVSLAHLDIGAAGAIATVSLVSAFAIVALSGATETPTQGLVLDVSRPLFRFLAGGWFALLLAVWQAHLDAGAAAAIAGASFAGALAMVALWDLTIGRIRRKFWTLGSQSIRGGKWLFIVGPAALLIGFEAGHQLWQ